MSENQRDAFLQIDREDLLAVIAMRFGAVPETVRERILACQESTTVQRWLLVAANAASWDVLLEDLAAGTQAFRLIGPRYQPVATDTPSAAVPRQHVREEN
jgi:hypothetical protein